MGEKNWLTLTMAILPLAFTLAGCAESANYRQHELTGMVTQPSEQDTN